MAQAQRPATRSPIGADFTLRQKLALMYILMLTMFLTALDQSIVATAIPHIVADLHGFQRLPWVFTIYVLTSTVVIPPIGKLSDMFGRKPFLLAGIAVFVASSAACGAAPTMEALIAARAVQGIGAGLIVSGVFATLGDIFAPVERAKYFPLFIGMFTFAGLIGPTFGGVLTDGPGWRWCFYLNLPVGVLATLFIALRMPSDGGAGGHVSQVDFVGATLLGVATTALLLTIELGERTFGWTAPETAGLFVTALVFAGLFIFNESRHPQPIIPLQLFRNAPFVQAIGVTLCFASFVFSAQQFLPTYLQIALGTSARTSGLIATPMGLGVFFSGLLTGQLISRTGRYRLQMVVGALGLSTLAFLLRTIDADTPRLQMGLMLTTIGLFAGLVMPVTQVIIQGSVSQAEQGVASSSRQFFLQIAQVMGIAIVGLIFTSSYSFEFERSAAPLREAVPPAAYEAFRGDPTISLDPARYASVRAAIVAQPDGETLLAATTRAQREGVAAGMANVYTATLASAVVILLLCLRMREIPLRRSLNEQPAIVEAAG